MARRNTIGTAEKAVLSALLERQGKWADVDGVLWESKYWTIEILGTLANKGLVREIVPAKQYELTPDGAAKAALLPVLWGGPNRRAVHLPTQGSYRRARANRHSIS